MSYYTLHSDKDWEPRHISQLIEQLQEIMDTYGDAYISVTDTNGNKLSLTGDMREWADPDYILDITAEREY